MSNPWNGKVVLEAFWWDCWNNSFRYDWYSFLSKMMPWFRDLGFDGIWIPPPCKGASPAGDDMGYLPFDYYDLGHKNQQGQVNTRFGSLDSLLRLVAIAHANGIEVYPDIVLDHCGGDTNKNFGYAGFAAAGRWGKSWLDFHQNTDHNSPTGDWPRIDFGVDICYRGRCTDSGHGDNNSYMRAMAREWLVWFTKQTDVDGFRFDDVKGFPPEVVEDLLFNAMGSDTRYFCVGEFVDFSTGPLDDWAGSVQGRSGTFDYAFRHALVALTYSNGFFDMGSLPNAQQQNRYKTVPFVNNHDVYRGAYWDSSGNGQQDHTGRSKTDNTDELDATIDPDNWRARLAYAAMVAIDGSPQFYYEDLFLNFPLNHRWDNDATSATLQTRQYVENLVWCHQKLEFKAGAYKVRYQGSQQLLIIERSARAIIGMNNDGSSWHNAWIATDFGPNVELHDYSGSRPDNIWTNQDGWVNIAVSPVSYSVWAPAGISGGFNPTPRRTTQEFQMDDDLGDSNPITPGYGGKLIPGTFRKAGSIWAAANSDVNIWIYLDGAARVDLQVLKPSLDGKKSSTDGAEASGGNATNVDPLFFHFRTDREGFHQINARLNQAGTPAVRAYVKVDYIAPAQTNLNLIIP
jgi:alpha-amylase